MAGGMDLGTGGKGGKKPLDAAINLVPFIDLMAVTISFLIMTAVWTQIGRLEVSQRAGPTETTEEQPKENVPITLLVTGNELRVTVGGLPQAPITIDGSDAARLDLGKLVVALKELAAQFPNQKAITIQAEDTVRYDVLVRIIDECIGAGLPEVSVEAALG